MALISRSTSDLSKMRKYKWVEKDIISPERTKIWTTDNKSKSSEKKVAVIYYLSRNGQLEHPHFMEVPLSSSTSSHGGLYLKDVFNRLDFLRGKGMTNMYSWSSRRIYKNGFVWQDLSENDLILPTKACEYILKGSEILLNSTSLRYPKAKSMRSFDEDDDCRNQSWRYSIDDSGCEYRVYKTDSMKTEGSKGLDAATQTGGGDGDGYGKKVLNDDMGMEMVMEMNRDEISPPLSSSRTSLESWDSVSEGRKMEMEMRSGGDIRDRGIGNGQLSGRMKASVVLKQLVSCGSVSVMESALLKSKKGASMASGKSGLGEESVRRGTKDLGN